MLCLWNGLELPKADHERSSLLGTTWIRPCLTRNKPTELGLASTICWTCPYLALHWSMINSCGSSLSPSVVWNLWISASKFLHWWSRKEVWPDHRPGPGEFLCMMDHRNYVLITQHMFACGNLSLNLARSDWKMVDMFGRVDWIIWIE